MFRPRVSSEFHFHFLLFINVCRLGHVIPHGRVQPKVHPEKEGVQIGLVHSNRLHRHFKYEQHPNLTDKGQGKSTFKHRDQHAQVPSRCLKPNGRDQVVQHHHFSQTVISVKVYILHLFDSRDHSGPMWTPTV